nr:LD-carboxypeptidase [Nonomuraea zeae]
MMTASHEPPDFRWPRLQVGDHVALVSPASFPDAAAIEDLTQILSSWGLRVKVGEHVLDQRGDLAGHDTDRLADLNAAFADPEIRAVITTRGGAGAYRILDGLDFDAIRADPKPLVGFSDITYLHLAIWRQCRIPGIHGCLVGPHAIATVRHLLTSTEPSTHRRNPQLLSVAAEVPGHARGHLLGGWLGALAGMVGAGLPDLAGAILLIEAGSRTTPIAAGTSSTCFATGSSRSASPYSAALRLGMARIPTPSPSARWPNSTPAAAPSRFARPHSDAKPGGSLSSPTAPDARARRPAVRSG